MDIYITPLSAADRAGGTCDHGVFALKGDTPCLRPVTFGGIGEPTPDYPNGTPVRLCSLHATELAHISPELF